jgi:hypothetical protein
VLDALLKIIEAARPAPEPAEAEAESP